MLSIIQEQDVTVVELGGKYASLDEKNVFQISEQLAKAASSAEPPRMVIDFSQTVYIGSLFLEVLIRAWKLLKKRNGTLVLCGLTPLCREVLTLAKLDLLWKISSTRQEALAAITIQ